MGAKYQFICEGCGYEADVSGGDDFSFRALTTTIFCEECEELYARSWQRCRPCPETQILSPASHFARATRTTE
jgi:hypothetical protein